MYKIVKECART